jgi:hypothetical protein
VWRFLASCADFLTLNCQEQLRHKATYARDETVALNDVKKKQRAGTYVASQSILHEFFFLPPLRVV